MSKHDYEQSGYIELASHNQRWSFYALLMAVIRRADTDNLAALERAFPDVVKELRQRYSAPGGVLESDTE